MVRTLTFLFLSFLVLAQGGRAFAQGVAARVSAQEGYGRVVFEWPEAPSFTLEEKGAGTLFIHFSRDAEIESDIESLRGGQNILGVRLLKTAPLELEIDIPEKSNHRIFSIGRRVILDIYDPPGGPQKAKPAAAPEKPQEPPEEKNPEIPQEAREIKKAAPMDDSHALPEEAQSESEAENQTAATQEESALPPESAEAPADHDPHALSEPAPGVPEEGAPAAPPAKGGVLEPFIDRHALPAPPEKKQEESSAEKETVEEPSFLEKAVQKRGTPTLISWSTTQSVRASVFEDSGHFWIMTEKEDPFMTPKVSGKDAGRFVPFEEPSAPKGKVFRTRTLPGSTIRVEGGGLSWRLVISKNPEEMKAVEPVRTRTPRGMVLVWPLSGAGEVVSVDDPVTGGKIHVVTVESSGQIGGLAQDFVEFELLKSYAGLALRPKVDDLEIRIMEDGVEVSRPGGLSVMESQDLAFAGLAPDETGIQSQANQFGLEHLLYHFEEWRMGGLDVLDQNQNIILSAMDRRSRAGQIEDLIMIAKMHLGHGRGSEALGFLSLVQQNIPEIEENPEFLALRGVAKALDHKYIEAFQDLFKNKLKRFGEVRYWKAFVLAGLEDWQQAASFLPTSFSRISHYPVSVRDPLALTLAEVALRAGDVEAGESLLEMVVPEDGKETLPVWYEAARNYLQGEAARQRGDLEATKAHWKKLIEGRDDLYRAKAGLALTRLLAQEEGLPPEEVIDRLETLRYGWRGDSLEARINFWLGRAYFDTHQYIKGLKIMRNAASLGQNDMAKRRIINSMSEAFSELFLSDALRKVPPFEAVAMFEEFSELIPPGDAGNKMTEMLAEHLARSNLLEKAITLFKEQLDQALNGFDAARIGVRTAALLLLDERPEEALDLLFSAEKVLKGEPDSKAKADLVFDLALLRARGLSKSGKTDKAIALLEDMPLDPDVNRLRADIAWSGGYWDDASHALNDVLLDQDISLTRPLTPDQSNLILSRAVALNLASDRIALANLREKYADVMSQTPKAQLFDVITRPRHSAALADRETLLSVVSEVDLFKDFLDNYRQAQPIMAPAN